MNKENLETLEEEELAYTGNTDNLEQNIRQIDRIVDEFGGDRKSSLESALMDLIMNVR